MIGDATRNLVRARAGNRCEYCRLPEAAYALRFVIDLIRARQHGGSDSPDNLALCCPRCNRKKGPNIAGVDPTSGHVVRLFDPRRDDWRMHFRWNGPTIVALTMEGRATVQTLDLNESGRVRLRQSLMEEGLLPGV